MSANFRSKVTRGFAWNHLYKITEYGLINLYNVLVIRHFGPDLVGPYALYLSIGTTLSLIGAFAVDGVLLRYSAHAFADDGKETDPFLLRPVTFLHKLLSLRLIVVTFIALLVVLVLWVLPVSSPEMGQKLGSLPSLAPYLVIFLFAQAIIAYSSSVMLGLLDVRPVFLASLISRVLLILLGFLALAGDVLTLDRAVLIHTLAAVVYAVALFLYLNRKLGADASPILTWLRSVGGYVREYATSWSLFRTFLGSTVISYGIATWGTDLLSAILSRQPDILMLSAILGEHSAQLGYYQVGAMLLLLAEYALLFGLGGTLVAAFSNLSREDQHDHSGERYPKLANARRKVFRFQLATTTPLFFFLIFFAEPFVQLVFGRDYLPVVPMFQAGLSVLLLTVGFVGGGMHVTSLVSVGRQKTVFRVRLFWGALNLVGNYFLIINFGAIGALLGTQVANLGACATESVIADRLIGPSREWSAIVKIILVSAVSTALPWLLLSLVEVGPFVELSAACILAVVTYFGMSRLAGLRDVNEILARLSETFLSKTGSKTGERAKEALS
jgi:O-antigen/teichoic acid export membrane protein